LSDPKDIALLKFEAGDYIVLLAAISSPDVCEDQYDFAYAVNVTGTSRLIEKALSCNAKILFFSSDTVIGESQVPADEHVDANPIGAYAEMKYHIEQKYRNNGDFNVFRLSYVFSKNDKFTSYIEQCSKDNTAAEVFNELYRNVIYIEDVVDAIISLSGMFEKFDNNLFHLVGDELFSRLEMATILKEQVWNSLEISAKEPPAGFFDRRPAIISVKSLYISELLGKRPTSLKDAVKQEFGKELSI
jgi:dTDP-4-dehydrorhamnose reductase